MKSFCPSTSKFLSVTTLMLVLVFSGCISSKTNNKSDMLYGQIAYPFVSRTQPLGYNGPEEKFVIKSAVGGTEYVVEIPQGAKDYDIEIPIADIKNQVNDPMGLKPTGISQPMITDRELVANFPKIARSSEDAALVDNAFGVGDGDGPTQSPSYTLSIAKIGKLYKKRQFEYCLIEINNLISFYPNSPRLYKMKGTILLKLRSYQLAKEAWLRAQELDPSDRKLSKSIQKIEEKLDLLKKPA